jgi:hypothetical protein
VYVENIDVRSTQLLERSFYGQMKRFGVVACIVNLVGDIILASLKASRILPVSQISTSTSTIEEQLSSTLVAMTSWSRMPRFSAHSPIKASEVSSWLIRLNPEKMTRLV